MNWCELEAVSLIERYRSYNDAAKDNNISVSALFKRVANVEAALDLKLFQRERTKNSVSLTTHGQELIPLFRQMISTHSSMLRRAEDHLNISSGTIAAGVAITLDDLGSGELMSRFFALHPEFHIITVLKSQREILRLLSEGKLDCAFIIVAEDTLSGRYWERLFAEACGDEHYEVVELKRSRDMWIGLSSKDALSRRSSVTLEDLRYHTFIFNRTFIFDHSNGDGLMLKDSFFTDMGVNSKDYDVIYEDFMCRSYIYHLLANGAGVLPQAFRPAQDFPGGRFVRLEGWSKPHKVFFAARKYESGALNFFTQFIRGSMDDAPPEYS